MWIMTTKAFVSIVEHRDDVGLLLVRARAKRDIHELIPDADVWEDEEADYRYRAEVRREIVMARIAEAVGAIDYPNFKDAVPSKERHDAYLQIWSIMRAWGMRVGRSSRRRKYSKARRKSLRAAA